MAEHEFDIIVYGATGYTGRLVAEYLGSHYGNGSETAPNWAPRWAMAGRSQEKLEAVRDEIGAAADTPLVVADAANPASLEAMCARTKVVLTTVGPYQLYGDALVDACVKTGTDYADLCGEPAWMAEQIEKHHDAAKQSGARICFSSGFDSIPFDLGVLMTQRAAKHRFGEASPRIRGRVRAMAGTFSGGTAASLGATMQAAAKNPEVINVLRNPFALTQGYQGPEQPHGMAPQHEADLDLWSAPFVMAPINTKNVHRTNFLLGHPYGENFQYDEMMLTGSGEQGEAMANAAAQMMQNPFGDEPPKPGEGPSKEERENGFYDVLFLADAPDGKEALHFGVKGKYDPGYGSTSRMISETGIALLSSDAEGGIGTPGSFLGEALVDRLQEHAEISFTLEN